MTNRHYGLRAAVAPCVIAAYLFVESASGQLIFPSNERCCPYVKSLSADGLKFAGASGGAANATVWSAVDGSIIAVNDAPTRSVIEAIDRSGQSCVGWQDAGADWEGVVFNSDLATTLVPPLSGSGIRTPLVISGDGRVVAGQAVGYPGAPVIVGESDPPMITFVWTAEHGMESVPHMFGPGDRLWNQPTGVSADGAVVVGYETSTTGGYIPFVWRRGIGTQLLDFPMTNWTYYSVALGVSDDGRTIVGSSSFYDPVLRKDRGYGIVWVDGGEMTSLPYPDGYDVMSCYGVSHDGRHIFGMMAGPGQRQRYGDGFVYSAEFGIINLSDVMARQGITLADGCAVTFRQMSDDALVFLCKSHCPTPDWPLDCIIRFAPYFCVADVNSDGGVDGSDIEAFFTVWETGEALGDFNSDGGVDGADIEYFFNRWEAGC